ncbi:3D (Asp-Asp-Asp) domain-containing protein [Paenibacillus sp. DS2015]
MDVRNRTRYDGMVIVAVDPNVIPLKSTLKIRLADGTEMTAIALDTGTAIKGRKIDVLMARLKDARDFGRQDVKVRILN